MTKEENAVNVIGMILATLLGMAWVLTGGGIEPTAGAVEQLDRVSPAGQEHPSRDSIMGPTPTAEGTAPAFQPEGEQQPLPSTAAHESVAGQKAAEALIELSPAAAFPKGIDRGPETPPGIPISGPTPTAEGTAPAFHTSADKTAPVVAAESIHRVGPSSETPAGGHGALSVQYDEGPSPTPAADPETDPARNTEAVKSESAARPRLVLVSWEENCPACELLERYVLSDRETVLLANQWYEVSKQSHHPIVFGPDFRKGVPYIWFPDTPSPTNNGRLSPPLPVRDPKAFLKLLASVPHDPERFPNHPSNLETEAAE